MNRRLALLSAVALAIASYAVWIDGSFGRLTALLSLGAESDQHAAGVIAVQPVAARREPAILNPIQAVEMIQLSAIADRPLFNPERKPRPPAPVKATEPLREEQVVEAPPPVDEGPSEDNFTLLAISSSPSAKIAAVRLNTSSEVVYLRKGDPVLNWEVLNVGERDISIGAGDRSVTLSLFSKPTPAVDPKMNDEDAASEAEVEQTEQQAVQPVEQNRF